MKNNEEFKVLITIIILIILSITVHMFEGIGENEFFKIIGATTSAFFILIFGLFIIKKQKEYKKSEKKLKSILDSTAEAIYGVDLKGRCIFANKSCVELLGYENESDLIGEDTHKLIHHSYPDGSPYPKEECMIYNCTVNGKEYHAEDEFFWRADGTYFNVEYRVNPEYSGSKLTGAVVTFMDITEKKLSEDRIKYLSYHDPVTGLYNQTFMFEETKRLDVERNLPFSIILADVNGLKLTNDIFGHDAGDLLLKKIANAISRSCRADDIVARVGGDEFIILLPNTTTSDAEKILHRIKEEVVKEDYNVVKGSVALGLSTKTNIEEDIKEIFREAEDRMYKNKNIGQSEEYFEQLSFIIKTLHEKSVREKIHSQNVSELSERIAIELNLAQEDIRRAKEAGYYHDIGKIILSEEILSNLGKLTPQEQREMNKHAITGYRILNIFNETVDIAKGVLDHHEYWDGTGYPKGLENEEISILGRIIAVAEYYDSKTNPHSNVKVNKEEAIQEIKKYAGIKFDPAIVVAFLNIIDK